jgi:hypothetical protein
MTVSKIAIPFVNLALLSLELVYTTTEQTDATNAVRYADWACSQVARQSLSHVIALYIANLKRAHLNEAAKA